MLDNFPIEQNASAKTNYQKKNLFPYFNFKLNFNSKYLYVFYAFLLFISIRSLNNVFQPASFVIDNSINNNSENELNPQEINNNIPEDKPTPAVQNAVITPPKPEELNVKMVAKEDSWVRIVVDGKTEYEGILTKGSEQEWTAKKELTIRAGNAGGLLISVNENAPKQIGESGQVEEVTLNL